MSFSTFNWAPPNLCCKHVPTDSLKELIAPNNLTIWLRRSIPTRLLALRRLGPIQMPPSAPQSCRGAARERERGGKREVVKACQEAEKRREWQRPPSAPCLSCWRPRTPAETLNLYDPNGRPLTGMLLREDREREKGSKWERRKTKEEMPEHWEQEDPTSLIIISIFPLLLSSSLETLQKMKCKSWCQKKILSKNPTLPCHCRSFWAVFYVQQERTGKKKKMYTFDFLWPWDICASVVCCDLLFTLSQS